MAVGAGLRTHVVGLREDIERIVAGVNRKGIVIRVRASDFTQPLGRMSAKANEFSKSLEASNARVIAFGASAAIIGGVTTSFAQLFVQAQKVEKILTDINVVLGTTASNLQKFGDGLFKVAKNTSQALEVAAEAALEFSRQGLSMEETLKRTNDALILTRLTGIKAADAVKGLTAAVNGFADAGLSTTQIINKLAAVDVKFAVSADDLVDALARAGAVAQDAGVSFDQLIGSVTAAQQITARGGAVIGNSFKTIFTRIQRSSTITRLEELGVAVRDIRGNTLPAITVLTNLSKAYDQLGDTTKAAVAEQVGGVFQINILKAALKDLGNETSLYAQATKISSQATDEAQRKNDQLQKTLAAISNQSFTNLRELTANLGELTVAPALKEFLKSFNQIAEVMSKLFGSEEGESIGGDFAKGFARAFGSVLTGPGLMVGALIFGKLFQMAFKFAKNSVKDILQIKTIKDQELAIQEAIVDAMVQNVALNKELFKLDGDQLKQEQVMLKLLSKQTAFLEKQRQIASSIAPGLRVAGVNENLTVTKGSKSKNQKSEGFIPNYASKNAANNYGGVTPLEKQSELAGAMKAGYQPGSIKSTNINGLGRVIYNDAETIKQFPNLNQPAIMPPLNSKAGRNYKVDFRAKHGFNPYEQGGSNNSTYSNGFISNFAAQPMAVKSAIRAALKKRGARMRPNDPKLDFHVQRYLSATKNRDFPNEFINIGGHKINMNEITLALKKQGGYHNSFNESKAINLQGSSNNETYNSGLIPNFALAAQRLGNTNILRLPTAKMVTQTTQSDFKGNKVKGWRTLEAPLDNVLKFAASYKKQFQALKSLGFNSLQRKMYFGNQPETLTRSDRQGLRSKNLNKKGDTYEGVLFKSGLKNKGYSRTYDPDSKQGYKNATVDFAKSGKIPIEAKFGKFVPANLLAKSIRLSKDKYIENFLSSKRFSGLAAEMSDKKLGEAKNTLDKMGFPDANSNLIDTMGLSSGFIPNFSVKKIQNVIDGDSVVADVFVGTQSIDHRLKGVDAVEKNQAFGTRAQTLAKSRYKNNKEGRTLLERNRVSKGSAAYNRGLFADEQLAKDLVAKGYGIPDIGYLNKAEYKSYVRDVEFARKAKKGIWGKSHFRENKKTGKVDYLHPKAKMYIHQWELSQGKKWSDINVRNTRFKGANQATYGYASGKGSKGKNTYSFGLVPNFSNPLQDAIQRESNAGVPKSLIRVDQDNSLRSTQNPMGLAVINTRDEPAGVKQGIQRAKQMGIDPKSHGSSSGFLPNFNTFTQQGGKAVHSSGKYGFKEKSKGAEKATKEAGGAMDGLMMKMFALATVTYALDGALGEAESGMSQFMKVTNSAIMGLSQASMVAGLGRETGKSLMAKGAQKGNLMGGLQKAGGLGMMALGPLGAAVAVAVPVFNSLKENTTLLDSGLDTLRKSAEKTSKGINVLGSAMTAATGIQETRTKLVELDASAMSGTYQGEMKRLKLNAQLIKQQSELGSQAATLGKNLNLSGKEIQLMTSGTAEGMKKLQEAMLKAEQSMAVQNAMSGFILGSKGGGIFGDDPDPLMAGIQKLNLANIVSTSVDSDKLEANYATMLEKVKEAGAEVNDVRKKQTVEGGLFNDVERFGVPKIIEDFKKSISESDLDLVLKSQLSAALDGGKSFEEIAKFLEEQEITVKQLNGKNKKQANQTEVNLLLMREIAKQRKKILTGLKIESIAYESQIKISKMGQDFDIQKLVHQNKIIESLGILSNQSIADLQMKEKSQAIDNDFNNKKEALNREALQAQRGIVKDLFTEGGKFNSAEMFADLRKSFTTASMLDANMEPFTPLGPDVQGPRRPSFYAGEKTFEGGTKQAHEGQLEIIRKNLTKAGEEQLAEQLEGVENYQRANNVTVDYLLSLKNQAHQASLLYKLQDQGIIPANIEIESLLEEISDMESAKLDAVKKEREFRIKNLNLVRNELEANSKTVEYAKERAAEYERQKAALGGITGVMKAVEQKYYEEIDSRNENLKQDKEISNAKLQVLTSAKYQKDLAESLEGTVQKQLITELGSLVEQGARLDAEEEVRKNTQLFAKILETKVKNEIKELNKGAGDDTDLLQEELRQGKFRSEANANYITSQNNLTRQQEKFTEALQRGQFGLDALAEIQGAVNDLIKSMEMAKTQMAFYANQEGSAGTGNEIKGAEATLKYAQAQKELNIEQNKGTLFADSMAVKIAEANAEMARFGETLANTTFDAVQDGFKGFVNDMISGTKSLGDAALGFAHGIVSKIHEQLLNRATSQITAGIFEGLGMGATTSKQGGGIVSRYSTGGSVGRVPAMLTNGEYVVKKKIVDKLGVNDLNKINQTGSLEDLYNKPNENGFEMMNSGGLAMPPIIKLKEGGSIQNYLAKRDQSSDSGSQNERTIVDGEVVNTLSNTIAKFMGGLAKFSFGGRVKEATKNSLISDPNDTAGVKIAKGSGYLAGTVAGGYQGYEAQAYSGSAPIRVNPLNTRSMLNVDPSSRSMSARFRAQDDYSSKYGDYLLDKYQHDVNQRNEKLKSRASMMQGIVNQIGMMGVMYGTEQAVRSAFQPEKRKEYHTSIDNSQVNAFRDYQVNQQTKSDKFLNKNTSISQNNISSAYSIGGGNLSSNEERFFAKNSGYSEGGRVHGPAGIDKVGPVMLDRGEFVIKASSVNKVEKQYPGFFDQLNTMKFNQGGVVDPSASSANVQNSEVTNNQSSSSNVTVNINVSAGGETTVNGGAGDQQAFASKIKEAVVNVISQEKRVGGMLR